MKICRTCKVNKPLSDYYKESRRAKFDGRSTQCKFCKKEKERPYISKAKPLTEKLCKKCNTIKPANKFHKNRGKRTGLCELCKDCRNVKIVEKRFGIEGKLDKMKKSVDYKCQICDNKLPLAVDHCHSTGKIRGLLCNNCNNGIGRFKDSIEYLKNAIKYLKEN